jgi:hypothetical protein
MEAASRHGILVAPLGEADGRFAGLRPGPNGRDERDRLSLTLFRDSTPSGKGGSRLQGRGRESSLLTEGRQLMNREHRPGGINIR